MIEPGTYLLRMAFADSEGRIGSIERKVDAWQMNATGVSVGDLLVAQAPSDNVERRSSRRSSRRSATAGSPR